MDYLTVRLTFSLFEDHARHGEQCRESCDGTEWCSQVVADVGEEVFLECHLAGEYLCLFKLVFHFLLVVDVEQHAIEFACSGCVVSGHIHDFAPVPVFTLVGGHVEAYGLTSSLFTEFEHELQGSLTVFVYHLDEVIDGYMFGRETEVLGKSVADGEDTIGKCPQGVFSVGEDEVKNLLLIL